MVRTKSVSRVTLPHLLMLLRERELLSYENIKLFPLCKGRPLRSPSMPWCWVLKTCEYIGVEIQPSLVLLTKSAKSGCLPLVNSFQLHVKLCFARKSGCFSGTAWKICVWYCGPHVYFWRYLSSLVLYSLRIVGSKNKLEICQLTQWKWWWMF